MGYKIYYDASSDKYFVGDEKEVNDALSKLNNLFNMELKQKTDLLIDYINFRDFLFGEYDVELIEHK